MSCYRDSLASAKPYNEHVAKVGFLQKPAAGEYLVDPDELVGRPWPKCANLVLPGECGNGHRFAKVLMCGREWCPDCGRKDSPYHRRRVARILTKAQQMESIGFLVIEWPVKSRRKLRTHYCTSEKAMKLLNIRRKTFDKWIDEGKLLMAGDTVRVPTKTILSQLRLNISENLKKYGVKRGIDRWHYFGDENPAVRGYNPHLNILFDGAFLPKTVLQELKIFLRSQLNEPELIVNYSFRASPGEKMHTLKYVTRATFLDRSWDQQLADDLFGFRNGHNWGVWKDEPAWLLDNERESGSLAAVGKMEDGNCPICGEPIIWGKPEPKEILQVAGAKHIGGGYFWIRAPGDPPELLDTGPEIDRMAHNELELLDIGYKQFLANLNSDPAYLYDAFCDSERKSGRYISDLRRMFDIDLLEGRGNYDREVCN